MVSRSAGGLHQNNLLLGRFIHACSARGLSNGFMTNRNHGLPDNIYHLNSAIKALSSQPHSAKHALILYNSIRSVPGLRPDTYSLLFALKAVVHLSVIQAGRGIHSQAIASGLDTDLHVMTALIRMYGSCGSIADARKLFDEMRFRDVASWNAIIAGYAKVGDVHSARHLLERMPKRNVISWTSVIAAYAQVDRPSDAIFIFRRMQLEGVEPDEVTMLAVLSACARLGALELGQWVHNHIDKHRLRKTIPLNNALIDMYAKSGNINKAMEVFENMKYKSIVTWTTIISGLALHGLGREALEMFSRMETAQIKPNDITFIAVLSACCHVGLVEMGRWYFKRMHSRYGIRPNIKHYGCMIDLLGRSGCLQEAQELAMETQFEVNGAIWGSLLAAARIHGDVALAERCLQHLIMCEPHNGGNYAILSNMYAAFGWWNESGMMRKVMRDTGVIKVRGGSSIEVNNRVHEFTAGNRSHPQSERIYEVLSLIIEQLKMTGYMHEEQWELLGFEDGCFTY